jgi:hypothetical protein
VFALSLLSVPTSLIERVVDGSLGALTQLLTKGTSSLLLLFAKALDTSTAVPFGSSFTTEFSMIATIGGALAIPLLVLTAIQAILRQDLSLLLRTAFVRVPLALISSGIVVEVVRLSLAATDAMSSALLAVAGPPAQGFLSFLSTGMPTLAATGQVGEFFFAGIAALVSVTLWIELAMRSGAIVVATLFTPLALCGIIWPATAHWARRLGETLAALVLAKPVIAAVLALSVSMVQSPSGANDVVVGIALLLLAATCPYVLLRMVPIVDASVMGNLEAMSQRAQSGVGGLAAGAFDEVSALASRPAGNPVTDAPGTPFGSGEGFDDTYNSVQSEFDGRTEADLAPPLLPRFDDDEEPDGDW